MVYRIIVDLAVPDAVTLAGVRGLLRSLEARARVIREGHENEERGFIEVHRCYHDEDPTRPCEVVGRFEVGRGVVGMELA